MNEGVGSSGTPANNGSLPFLLLRGREFFGVPGRRALRRGNKVFRETLG